ncbi:Mor transcription activator family protein [Psychrobacter sp. HD31]|uniref:Mor transcription activator family protein n=1 Tax=Psychrobacter sp. HD31 TaxID=3112003 RepID=UPI003DA6029C
MVDKTEDLSANGVSLDVFDTSATEIIKDLADTTEYVATKHYGLTPGQAKKLGVDVALSFAEQCGGTQPYIPRELQIKISQRDMQMYKKFNGRNHDQLAKEFNCSRQWVYTVIKRVHKQLQDKQQPQLF